MSDFIKVNFNNGFKLCNVVIGLVIMFLHFCTHPNTSKIRVTHNNRTFHRAALYLLPRSISKELISYYVRNVSLCMFNFIACRSTISKQATD